MIKTTKVGICDRCDSESSGSINKLKLSSENLMIHEYATNFLPHTTGIAFNSFEGEGWHLCNACLSDFRRFVKKVTLNELEGIEQ